jgi:excinuclease UvrABC ATPase subunit
LRGRRRASLSRSATDSAFERALSAEIAASELLRTRVVAATLAVLLAADQTTGVHFDDVRKLLDVLHALVEAGNTVLVIEHNLEVIKTADWIIDLGPEAGDAGGHIVATGTPEDIAEWGAGQCSAAALGSNQRYCVRAFRTSVTLRGRLR